MGAHVVSWELANGCKVPVGMFICHHCDHPWCVNPNHLFVGTAKSNFYDMVEKGRFDHVKGESCGCAKNKEWQIMEIRAKYSTGQYTHRQLAKEYGVNHTTIGDIINYKIWKHI